MSARAEPAPSDRDLVINAFLRRYFADAAAGAPRSLAAYQEIFRGHDDLVSVEFARIAGAPAEGIERRVGRYRLIRELGRGGQGLVYLAVDTHLGRHVALKVLTGFAAFSHEMLLRFRREAEVASRIDHPGVCGVYDAGEDGRVPYIAMRYVDGETLAARFAVLRDAGAGPAPVSETVPLFEKAARALHAAHEAGVLHRDVKPGNVMVTKAGEPVILDFGLARALEGDTHALTQAADLFGTPAYMSPEQVSGSALDARTDVYSLGATLYEALTLRRPFEAPTRERLYHAICSERPPDSAQLNPEVAHDLRNVVLCAIDPDRNRRYQTALDLAEDLRRIRMDEAILARPVGPAGRLLRWARRNRGLAAALVALLGLLVVALAVTAALLHDARSERDSRDAALSLVERLSDVKRLEDLRKEAEDLWPAVPAMVPAMQAWLQRAAVLAEDLPAHRAALDRLRAGAVHATGGGRDAWMLPSTEQQWHHDTLASLVRDLEAFAGPDQPAGLIEAVRARLAFAGTVEEESLVRPRAAWRDAIAAIGDGAASLSYGGLRIVPQLGLVPIGRDPQSGLFEFAHIQSGSPPRRDGSGKLGIEAASGIVLVLIPGGRFEMGAVAPDLPGARGQADPDPDARADESPVTEVALDPFFISKYEMTQAQWQRVTGTNPATEGGGLYPLNHATHEECERILARIGLSFPTEAQWEYAARAGTRTRWWTGSETRSIGGAANVADRSAAGAGPRSWICEQWLDDGYGGLAPIGRFRPNPFGLHDVIGNLWEWCRDSYAPYADAVRRGDGLRAASAGGEGPVARGGSYIYGAVDARSARRSKGLRTGRSIYSGLRPARALLPE